MMPVLATMDTPFSAAQTELLRRRAEELGFTLREMDKHTAYGPDALADCQVLVGYFPRKLLRGAKSLRWMHLPSAGADKYTDETLYDGHPFVLTNSSGAFGPAIAEELLMGALMLLHRMPEYAAQQRCHVWNRVGNLRFLGESAVTVLGTGNLGGTFAAYCRSLGAEVTGVSRSGRETPGFSRVYPMSGRLEAVREADVVAACLPLTPETRDVLDGDFFAAMKPGAIFLNAGRGKTVRQTALIDALRSGHLGGALLDVAEEEPMPPDCPLWGMETVIITPHISGSDLDPWNTQRIFDIFMDNLSAYAGGRPLRNVVDRKIGY